MRSRLILLAILMISIPAYGGWFKNFCARYIIANDPHEEEQIIQEARSLCPNVNEFRSFLRQIYLAEMAKENPNKRLLSLIVHEIGQ